MDQPKIPTLKDSKKPQVKLRGLSSATLFDRLKQFKKKDLAFILAGLGTLFMAPLAEHFMMSPESADGTLQQGWGGHGSGANGSDGIFGGGGSPYEPGTSGLAPGGPTGGGGDVITPLNVRDPASLIMGPGSTQEPPTNSVAPATPPPTAPTPSNADLKDALAASAARGIGAAAKRALLPVPPISLSGSNLRGLGVTATGTSAQWTPPKINDNLAPNRVAMGGGLSPVVHNSHFAGVARGPGTGGGGSLDALKKAAAAAGDAMNRTGSAATDLNNAASTKIDGNGHGFGGGGQGGNGSNDKAPGDNNSKGSKNVGESLAYDIAKQKAMDALKLAEKEKEANDWNLRLPKLEDKLLGDLSSKVLGGCVDHMMGGQACITPPSGTWGFACTVNGTNNVPIPASDFVTDGKDCNSGSYMKTATGFIDCSTHQPMQCTPIGGSGSDIGTSGANGPNQGVTGMPGMGTSSDVTSPPAANLNQACTDLKSAADALNKSQTPGASGAATSLTNVVAEAAKIVTVRDAFGSTTGGNPTGDCGATAMSGLDGASGGPLLQRLNNLKEKFNGAGGVIGKMDKVTSQTDATKPVNLDTEVTQVVGDSSQGLIKDIATLKSDVSKVATYEQGIDKATVDNPSPVSPDLLRSLGGQDAAAAKAYGDKVNGALATVRNSYTTIDRLVTNMNTAADGLVQQETPLTNSDGAGQNLAQIVQVNQNLDQNVVKKIKDDSLQKPVLDAQKGDQAQPGDVGHDATDQAQQDISTLSSEIQAYYTQKNAGQTPTPDAKKVNGDIANVAKEVRQMRGSQQQIDANIGNAVTTAASKVGL
ncbi:MAG: hypothetical protein KGM24_14795 [Elusimicrobia bacterium]|nr:hypothetical protein [Elusimicrobiota bacterium]